MGRERGTRIAALLGLGLLLAVGVSLVLPRRPAPTSLATVSANPDRWRGMRVQVSGRLRELHDPVWKSYGVLEDSGQNRIGLKDVGPWRGLVGHRVVAVGTVRFDPSFGLYLAQPTLRRAAGP